MLQENSVLFTHSGLFYKKSPIFQSVIFVIQLVNLIR